MHVAALPIESSRPSLNRFREAGGIGDRNHGSALADAAYETGKDPARSEFEELVAMEMIEKVFDAFRPPNAAGHLVGESPPDRCPGR